MTRILLAAAFGLVATYAQASITQTQVATLFQHSGYTNIEITTGPSQMKVEALKGAVKVEVIYDITTGRIVVQHNVALTGAVAARSDVVLARASRDFASASGSDSGSGSGTEVGDDNGGTGTETGDDNGGSTGGSGGSQGSDDSGSTSGSSGGASTHGHSKSDN